MISYNANYALVAIILSTFLIILTSHAAPELIERDWSGSESQTIERSDPLQKNERLRRSPPDLRQQCPRLRKRVLLPWQDPVWTVEPVVPSRGRVDNSELGGANRRRVAQAAESWLLDVLVRGERDHYIFPRRWTVPHARKFFLGDPVSPVQMNVSLRGYEATRLSPFRVRWPSHLQTSHGGKNDERRRNVTDEVLDLAISGVPSCRFRIQMHGGARFEILVTWHRDHTTPSRPPRRDPRHPDVGWLTNAEALVPAPVTGDALSLPGADDTFWVRDDRWKEGGGEPAIASIDLRTRLAQTAADWMHRLMGAPGNFQAAIAAGEGVVGGWTFFEDPSTGPNLGQLWLSFSPNQMLGHFGDVMNYPAHLRTRDPSWSVADDMVALCSRGVSDILYQIPLIGGEVYNLVISLKVTAGHPGFDGRYGRHDPLDHGIERLPMSQFLRAKKEVFEETRDRQASQVLRPGDRRPSNRHPGHRRRDAIAPLGDISPHQSPPASTTTPPRIRRRAADDTYNVWVVQPSKGSWRERRENRAEQASRRRLAEAAGFWLRDLVFTDSPQEDDLVEAWLKNHSRSYFLEGSDSPAAQMTVEFRPTRQPRLPFRLRWPWHLETSLRRNPDVIDVLLDLAKEGVPACTFLTTLTPSESSYSIMVAWHTGPLPPAQNAHSNPHSDPRHKGVVWLPAAAMELDDKNRPQPVLTAQHGPPAEHDRPVSVTGAPSKQRTFWIRDDDWDGGRDKQGYVWSYDRDGNAQWTQHSEEGNEWRWKSIERASEGLPVNVRARLARSAAKWLEKFSSSPLGLRLHSLEPQGRGILQLFLENPTPRGNRGGLRIFLRRSSLGVWGERSQEPNHLQMRSRSWSVINDMLDRCTQGATHIRYEIPLLGKEVWQLDITLHVIDLSSRYSSRVRDYRQQSGVSPILPELRPAPIPTPRVNWA
ncbi:MAG: hypothetical protein M1837_007238 [Sclerophora amabilis]|nr:MAG: hypothetical protein M1837_007238 [Sclerophora amabilis]